MLQLVDTHCHLDVPEFDADRDAVVARARAAGVTRQIVPAIEASTWPALRDACAKDAGLFPAYGLHPLLLASHREEHLRELREWIERERPVAIGECGLDYWVEHLDRELQEKYFDAQLRLAREFELPVVVHARRAVDAVITAIRRVGHLRGVIHSYPGSEQQAKQLADLGFLIGIGGPVTYERANKVRRVAASVPIETLLLETDAPDQPNSDRRGERNEPACMTRVLEVIAELRNEDPAVIAKATTENAERLFGLR